MATASVAPRIMGLGPATATRKVLAPTGLTLAQIIDVIDLNETFVTQGLAVLRDLGLPDDDALVNPNGGAIALGHPLGASGVRLITTAVNQLHRTGGRCARCTMCIVRRAGHRSDRGAHLEIGVTVEPREPACYQLSAYRRIGSDALADLGVTLSNVEKRWWRRRIPQT
jgi:hypothetical protein